MPSLRLNDLRKTFDGVVAVATVSLDVPEGAFFSLLGPSGCGKTTLLRMIAGLETPDEGSVIIGGRDVTKLPPEKRRIGMVFQNYALFPHMTVWENLAFGLKTQGVAKAELDSSVNEALALVGLSDKAKRPAPALSGGEQQRVALARAIVTKPDVLLFDEPLSNLDARLRVDTRAAIRRIVDQLGITSIYVTHDQEEALSLSDQLAVMNAGSVVQYGEPEAVYDSPVSPFVASFLGRANLVSAKRDGDHWRLDSGYGIKLDHDLDQAVVLVRPEDLEPCSVDDAWVSGQVTDREFLGPVTRVRVSNDTGVQWEAMLSKACGRIELGSMLHLRGNPDNVRVYAEHAS